MKKFTIALLLLVVLSIGAFATNDISVLINGNTTNFDVPPQIENGRTLVPLRAIFEVLGADVEWLNDTREIVSQFQGKEIRLQINNKQANNKGVMTTLDVPPQIKEGRTLVPLRFIAESLDKDVEWIADTRIVIINDKSDKPKEQPKEEIKEEPKPVVSNLPDSLEFGKYTDYENHYLYIKNYKDYFNYGNDYSFKTTCINRPDLNSFKSLRSDGKVITYRKDEWKSFNGASGEEDNTRYLYQLRFKDSRYTFIDPYALKNNIKDGEVIELEVQARYNPTGEVKTYYTQWVW